MSWQCPLCGRGGFFVCMARHASVPTGPGSGTSVCRRCEKYKKEEIQRLNARCGIARRRQRRIHSVTTIGHILMEVGGFA